MILRLRLQKPLVFGPRPDRKYDPIYQRALREAIEQDEEDEDRPIGKATEAKLDEELRLHLWLDRLEHRGLVVDRRLFIDAIAPFRQKLLAPDYGERMDAVCSAWQQDHGREAWARWKAPANARSTDVFAYAAAKATLTTTAAKGDTWIKKGRDTLRASPLALATFEQLTRETSNGAPLPAGPLTVTDYSNLTKLIKRVVDEETPLLFQEMCVGIVRELAELFPELPIGQRVSFDAQLVAAWAVQKSGKVNGVPSAELEARLTRRCPDAGHRFYGYDEDGIGDPEERSTIKKGKGVRGYLQVLVTEMVTGLPLVGSLTNAQTTYEPNTLSALLRRLYGMWPEIPLQYVVGDKLYDTSPACLVCELEFGVDPVFIRQPGHAKRGGAFLAPDEHKTIAQINGWGVASCRCEEHKLPMRMETLERPDRTGLAPGDVADARRLRYRLACTAPEPCARASVAIVTMDRRDDRELASALVALPHHHRSGRPELFARRQALQAARNSSSESAFSSLLLGYGLGGRDSKRPRVYDREALETLHWLGLGTRALVTLHAHRMYTDKVREHLPALERAVRR